MMNSKGYDADNLQQLATFLAYAEVGGARFTMGQYSVSDDGTSDGPLDDETECGSVGCAIGHAAFWFYKPQNISWGNWSEQLFITDPDGEDYGAAHTTWDWAFASSWQYVDNTRLGAAKRIQYLLNHDGLLPEGWKYSRKVVALYQSTEVTRDTNSKTVIAELLAKIEREPKFKADSTVKVGDDTCSR